MNLTADLHSFMDGCYAVHSALLPVAYVLCFYGYIESMTFAKGDWHAQFMGIVKVTIVVILIMGYSDGVKQLTAAFYSTVENLQSNNNVFKNILNAHLGKPPAAWDFANYILYSATGIFKSIGQLGLFIIGLLQNIAIGLLIAISPITLGFLATSITRNSGIKFLSTSLTVAAWPIAICLVDLLIAAIAETVIANSALVLSGAGAPQQISYYIKMQQWGILVVLYALTCIVPLTLYVLGIAWLQYVFAGANPALTMLSSTTGAVAASAGMARLAGAGAGGAAAGGATGAGAGASGGSLPASGSGIGTQGSRSISPQQPLASPMSVPGANSNAESSAPQNVSQGVGISPKGAYIVAPGASYSTASKGDVAKSPDGKYSAKQLSADQFAISGEGIAHRTVNGNIGNPQTLAAAYNQSMMYSGSRGRSPAHPKQSADSSS